MTRFDFDTPVDRRAVPALKTHRIVLGEHGPSLFAAGVADMDFLVASQITDALSRRAEHPVFGYEAVPDDLLPALRDWQSDRHGWTLEPEHILRAPNALNALAIAASLFSDPDDGIIVQPPVFFDFFDVIRENGRRVVPNPLLLRDGRYRMDFDGLEKLARDPRNRMLFLCSPHNPVGRVWTHADLTRLDSICRANGVLVVSDELHGDIVYPGHTHVPLAAISPQAAQNTITILSPAKAFNIAGCCSAFTVIADDARREAFRRENSRLTVNKNNAFANVAMLAAYRHGAPWLEAVTNYLRGNLAEVRRAIDSIHGVEMVMPEATFLVWLDFRGLGMAPDDLHSFLRQKARWAITRGVSFGEQGAGFMRLNIACPRPRLRAALGDLAEALANRA